MKRIYFTVTNDLTYDQRMQRICNSLAAAGYDICLVGRQLKTSRPLEQLPYSQKRFSCLCNTGFLFYAEFNLRLFCYLFFQRMDCICAIDLDTILPCLLVSKLKGVRRVYDAHEYFTEMKEVRTRPRVKRLWVWVERFTVPRFANGYTVSEGLAKAFHQQYQSNYVVIRNFPVLKPIDPQLKRQNFILYQGAVNEGRAFEYLIPALKKTRERLVICGDGNFMSQLKKLIETTGVQHQVELQGMLLPAELFPIAQQAALGISLAEKEGTNQYHALPNKFLDYIHAGLPQLTMAYPEYEKINSQFKVAILVDQLSPDLIAGKIQEVMQDDELRKELHSNCLEARKIFCWQNEEQKLIDFYRKILPVE